MKNKFIECGKIVSTHGIRGELKIVPWTDNPQYLLNFETFFLGQSQTPLNILGARIHKNMLLLKVEGVSSIEDAEALKGQVIYIDRDSDIDDAPFLQDFIGISVTNIDNGKDYGKITDIIVTGANDVFVLKDKDGIERLVPDIPDVVIEYDIDEQYMKIRPLKGLFEDED